MRVLSLIFCFMVIAQTFTVCTDSLISIKEKNSISYYQEVQADPGDQHTGEDLCSPFCQCACCATPTVAMSTSEHINLILTAETPFQEALIPGFLEISLSVWQPPQSA